jgi:patatin-like phospholipase/acyl hydrolase
MTDSNLDANAARINILSIDGGGIRGIIAAVLLNALEAEVGRPLAEVFDLIAGTSTGGIIALAIGTRPNHGQPYSSSDLVELYQNCGTRIFTKHWYSGAKALVGPKYSPNGLESVLEECFGETQLDTALTPLLISSYDLASEVPYFFKSHRIGADPSWNWPAKVIGRATSAAPTYFPPLRLVEKNKERALVDGGICVNNPGMAAYAEAHVLYPWAKEFLIVVVGTGDRDDRISYRRAKTWGLLGWAKQIVPVMMDSVSESIDYELDAIVGPAPCRSHYRLQPCLNIASPEMDDVDPQNLANLKKEAQNYLSQHGSEISQICTELKRGRGSQLPGTG